MPAPRPLIGVPCSTSLEPWYSPSYSLPSSYLRAIEAGGGVPVLIQAADHPATMLNILDRCDGLMLAGGEDIHPTAYGAPPHEKLELTNPQRDAAEFVITRHAIEAGKPVLGICRGLQLLNVVLGGTLYQDLASERPSAIDHTAGDRRRDFRALSHTIQLESDSWLAEQLGASELTVNSLHHQAIRDLAPGLRVTGYAQDGVVEAVEGTGPSFIAAVQAHPELIWEDTDPRWARMFAAFVARCAER